MITVAPPPSGGIGREGTASLLPEWLPVHSYEDLYEVSRRGEVRRIGGEPLVQFRTKRGYFIVKLSRNCRQKNFKVHRLVASAYIRMPEDGEQVNHIDLNKTNNCAENLEWCSHKQNMEHYVKSVPREVRRRKGGINLRAVSWQSAMEIRAIPKAGVSYKALAEKYNTTRSVIKGIRMGLTYVHP